MVVALYVASVHVRHSAAVTAQRGRDTRDMMTSEQRFSERMNLATAITVPRTPPSGFRHCPTRHLQAPVNEVRAATIDGSDQYVEDLSQDETWRKRARQHLTPKCP